MSFSNVAKNAPMILRQWWQYRAAIAGNMGLPQEDISREMSLLQYLDAVLEELRASQSVTRNQKHVDRLRKENATVKRNRVVYPAEQEASIECITKDVITVHSSSMAGLT